MKTLNKNMSAIALSFAAAFELYKANPHLVAVYADLPDVDLLTLVSASRFQGGAHVNAIAAELGWVQTAGQGWAWDSDWIKNLQFHGNLAYFYVFVKTANENVQLQQNRHR
jgi:hypothetical protein